MATEVVEAVWRQLCPGLVDADQVMDAPSSLKLIAPRPMLVANGEKDMRCPEEGVRQAVDLARTEYINQGAAQNLHLYFEPGGGHAVSGEMWRRVEELFATHLKPHKQNRKRYRDET